MAGRRNTKIRMPKNPFGNLEKIAKRGFYEIMWDAKPRDHGKRINGK